MEGSNAQNLYIPTNHHPFRTNTSDSTTMMEYLLRQAELGLQLLNLLLALICICRLHRSTNQPPPQPPPCGLEIEHN